MDAKRQCFDVDLLGAKLVRMSRSSSNLLQFIGTGLQIAKSAVYSLEGLPLIFTEKIFLKDRPTPPKDYLNNVLKHMKPLFAQDLRNIEQGYYPWTVLIEGSPKEHIKGLSRIGFDMFHVLRRKTNLENAEFSEEAEEYLSDLPEYYKRNFHFQSDGYLSETSAQRYDHQVEILFRGSAATMRRMIIPPLKDSLQDVPVAKIVEVGCGTGSSTRWITQSLPKAQITAVDLSWPYLKQAQKNLASCPRINFLQGDGAQLPFKDAEFDAWTSVFVFHELPNEERKKVLREAYRILKSDGLLVFADSIQLGDNPELHWGMEQFPKGFHEPFYAHYIKNPMERLIEECRFDVISSTPHFLTKVIVARKHK